MKPVCRPDVFKFENYRTFLSQWYIFEKSQGEFSYREFSARAGFKSPNFVKLVIDGQRNVTKESIRKLICALKLSAEEGTFFKNLVCLNQAERNADRLRFAKELNKSKLYRELQPLKSAAINFYQNWYSIPLREMIGSPFFREDPGWLAEKFLYKITPAQVKTAIENMLVLGVIRRNAEGRLEQVEKNISTGDEVESVVVANFHRQMMSFAAESIDTSKRHERDISGLTLFLSQDGFHRFKEMIQDFRKTILAEVDHSSSPKAVYQLNMQFFPVTNEIDQKESPGDSPAEGSEKWQKVS